MHSSRMRTARSSSCPAGVNQAPAPLPQEQAPRTRHPPGVGPPGSSHPPPQSSPPSRHPPGSRHPPLNILPCPKLRLRVVKITSYMCIHTHTHTHTHTQFHDSHNALNPVTLMAGFINMSDVKSVANSFMSGVHTHLQAKYHVRFHLV